MRASINRMLKCMRCVRNKLAVLSEVGLVAAVGHYAIESNLATKKYIADALFLSGS